VSKTATTAFWFSSSKIFIKGFRQILAAAFGRKRKSMAKIRTEVFIETSETFIVKRNRTFVRTWCEGCGREVSMVLLPEAALLTGYDVKVIYSMMKNHHIHFNYLNPETPSVCLRSLCLI
jgi:hypothetical protein